MPGIQKMLKVLRQLRIAAYHLPHNARSTGQDGVKVTGVGLTSSSFRFWPQPRSSDRRSNRASVTKEIPSIDCDVETVVGKRPRVSFEQAVLCSGHQSPVRWRACHGSN
jgi:hypothetical protein